MPPPLPPLTPLSPPPNDSVKSEAFFFYHVQGLIHISELSWNKIFTPEAVVHVGMFVRCILLSVDKEKGKLSLSLKASFSLSIHKLPAQRYRSFVRGVLEYTMLHT